MSERPKFDPLRAPVACVKGVGKSFADGLARLGIFRAFDLLFFFPRDYEEIFLKRTVDELVEGEVQSVVGTIEDYGTRRTRVGLLTTLFLAVGTSRVKAIWFKVDYMTRNFRVGRRLMLTGSPRKKDGRGAPSAGGGREQRRRRMRRVYPLRHRSRNEQVQQETG